MIKLPPEILSFFFFFLAKIVYTEEGLLMLDHTYAVKQKMETQLLRHGDRLLPVLLSTIWRMIISTYQKKEEKQKTESEREQERRDTVLERNLTESLSKRSESRIIDQYVVNQTVSKSRVSDLICSIN